MKCCMPKRSKSTFSSSSSSPEEHIQQQNNTAVKHEALLTIPGCKVHLMDEGEALEIAHGDFTLIRIAEENVSIATAIKVGEDLRWPLTKDEPVVKLDSVQYLFSLPMKDGSDPLSYGVTFSSATAGQLSLLDSFLKELCLFTCSAASSEGNKEIDWREFAPRIDDYNHVLARAIAGGTGQVVKGIFSLSNAYANQVQKGGETILIQEVEKKNGASGNGIIHRKNSKNNSSNKNLKRARNLSKMTEKMSKAVLDGVGVATGSVMAPVVRSQAGKTFLAMVPGQVLLASLDAVNKVLDAAEAAEKQALTATSGAVTRMVTKRFGENAGEATEDVLATTGHAAGTAWNVIKIRKAINPASSVSGGAIKSAAKNAKRL